MKEEDLPMGQRKSYKEKPAQMGDIQYLLDRINQCDTVLRRLTNFRGAESCSNCNYRTTCFMSHVTEEKKQYIVFENVCDLWRKRRNE